MNFDNKILEKDVKRGHFMVQCKDLVCISWHHIEQFFKRKVIDEELWLFFSSLWSPTSLLASISSISCWAPDSKFRAPDLFGLFFKATTNHNSVGSFHFLLIAIQVDVPISDAVVVSRGKNKNILGIPVDFAWLSINVSISLRHTVVQSNRAFWTSVVLFSMVVNNGNLSVVWLCEWHCDTSATERNGSKMQIDSKNHEFYPAFQKVIIITTITVITIGLHFCRIAF